MENEKETQEAEELEQEELDDEDLDLEEDFEFDDEGNIVIPDEDNGEEDEDDEDDEEDSPEGDGEEESLEDTPEENKPSEWEEKYRKLESQTKETLSKLNIKTPTGMIFLYYLINFFFCKSFSIIYHLIMFSFIISSTGIVISHNKNFATGS